MMNPVRNSENVVSLSSVQSGKLALEEEGETEKLAACVDRELTSPPIENLVEKIEPTILSSSLRQLNGHHAKRLRLENEGFDHVSPEVEDDCITFGRYVTATLKQMPKVQKLLAERIIAEVCFRGQTHSLHANTIVTTPASPVQQPYPVYAPRLNPFNRGTEYSMVHQQNIPVLPHTPLSMHVNAHPQQQYQNFVNIQQQSEQVNVPENIQ